MIMLMNDDFILISMMVLSFADKVADTSTASDDEILLGRWTPSPSPLSFLLSPLSSLLSPLSFLPLPPLPTITTPLSQVGAMVEEIDENRNGLVEVLYTRIVYIYIIRTIIFFYI
jgi:hypothetical protein